MSYANESSGVGALLEMVERGCARLMVAGGGALSQEQPATRGEVHRCAPAQKARGLEMARTGQFNCTQIARAIGSTQSAVFKMVAKAGIKTPDGRRAA